MMHSTAAERDAAAVSGVRPMILAEEGHALEYGEVRPSKSSVSLPCKVVLTLLLLLGIVATGITVALVVHYRHVDPPPPPIEGLHLTNSTATTSRRLILISADGFRWDYLSRITLPTIGQIINTGIRAHSMQPAFPSRTFPNHYSIVTGLYPSNHGIIDNTMYDPEFRAWFRLSDQKAVTDARWWWGEPMWVTCEKQNVRTGTYFWPGSEAPIMGVRPSHYVRYDGRIPYSERVDTLLEWLDLPEAERPRFLTMYMEGVDHMGHEHGPYAPEIVDAMLEVDAAMERLYLGLQARGMLDDTDVILTADHGMAQLDPNKEIYLDDHVDQSKVQTFVTYYPVLLIWPKPGYEAELFANLSNVEHMSMYTNTTVPERYHYANNRRIAPLVGLADPGWIITMRRFTNSMEGNHGYDNAHMDMHAIFMARGPSFKNGGVVVPTFENVHIYSLMSHILGVTPASNDGSLDAVQHLLR